MPPEQVVFACGRSHTHWHWLGTPPAPHIWPAGHAPQSMALLQKSEPKPQESPSCVQVFGLQEPEPHWFGPAAPQVNPPPHAPQSVTPPQPSGAVPHVAPSCVQVFGLHPHWFAFPAPPQVCGGTQPPQSIASLHMSEAYPQLAEICRQVLGVHGSLPHLFAPPPPQAMPEAQVPHSVLPPH